MLKKLNFLVSIAISTLIFGCANSSKKDNTLRAVKLTPQVEAASMVADLEVSDKKVMGQATGKALSKHELEKEAIAAALKQTDGDVLVGVNYFYETVKGTDLTVTIVGYPARYKNFRPREIIDTTTNLVVKGNVDFLLKNNVDQQKVETTKVSTTVAPATYIAPPAYVTPPPPPTFIAPPAVVNTPKE